MMSLWKFIRIYLIEICQVIIIYRPQDFIIEVLFCHRLKIPNVNFFNVIFSILVHIHQKPNVKNKIMSPHHSEQMRANEKLGF